MNPEDLTAALWIGSLALVLAICALILSVANIFV